MFHLILDLEMCKVFGEKKKEYGYGNEIIQIGAVMLDEEYKLCDMFNRYVCPVYGIVDPVIQELTGISDKRLRREAKLQDVLSDFVQWIGEKDYKVYTWSNSDYNQLRKELQKKSVADESFRDLMLRSRWVNYQESFGKRFDYNREVGLWEAIELMGLDFEGQAHDGYNDAYNTARIVEKLEKVKEFKLPVTYRNDKFEISTAPLEFSLGNLFDGIDLNLLSANCA